MQQAALFTPDEAAAPIAGWRFDPDFLAPDDEHALIAWFATLPLAEARWHGYSARRRVVHFGSAVDFDRPGLQPAPPMPPELQPLRRRAAAWLGVAPDALTDALVAEYRPGTPLGWHRDVPAFESVVGISLGSAARLRLRRWPPQRGAEVHEWPLPPRSAYVLSGEARWGWQHAIAPTEALRWSITFRTRRTAG